jgi:hypothetical protein
MRETPTLLKIAISRSRSWGEVVAYVISRRDEMRNDLDIRERNEVNDGPDHRESTMALGAIIRRISDSDG